MKRRSDFHVHIDGLDSKGIDGLVDRAKAANVGSIALLQKNKITTETEYAIARAEQLGISAYAGLETDASMPDGTKVGLVAIGFDPESEVIQSWLTVEARKDTRAARAHDQLTKLENMGFVFAGLANDTQKILDNILDGTSTSAGFDFGKVLSSLPENNGALQKLKDKDPETVTKIQEHYGGKEEYADTLDARFVYFSLFGNGKELSAKQIEVTELIDRIHAAGGVVLYSPEGYYDEDLWQELVDDGIDGIMAWHATQLGLHPKLLEGSDPPQYEALTDLSYQAIRSILQTDLLILGGSDAQGKDFQVGDGIGNMEIGPRRAKDLDARLEHIRAQNKVSA